MPFRNRSNLIQRRCLLASVFLTVLLGRTHAAELHVAPSGAPYTTIQAAVDAAAVGDRILIAEGTYSTMNTRPAPTDYSGATNIHQIVFIDKSITLEGGYDLTFSLNDPLAYPSVIDALNQGRCIFIESADPVIKGLNLLNGNAQGQGGASWDDAGGGIFARIGSPIILECNVSECQAGTGGGAFMSLCGFFNFLRVNFLSNQCSGMGGGAFLLNSDGYIDGCAFEWNTAGRMGGGMYISYSSPDVTGCRFRNNSATDYAGGLLLYDAWSFITANQFNANSAGEGGAIWSSLSTATIDRNSLMNNSATFSGGAIYFEDCNDTAVNNIIAVNQVNHAAGKGSAILCAGANVTLVHNTIVFNTGGNNSGIELIDSLTGPSNATIHNTIISVQSIGIFVDAGSTATFDSILWHDTVWDWGGPGTVNQGTHLYHGDPLYVDRVMLDFHIQAGSPAIDAGQDMWIRVDFDGQLRPWDLGFDIGADEYRYVPARGVWIECPLSVHPGEPFFATGFLENDGTALPGTYVFFVLDIAGEYWFWPSWSHYSAADPSSIDFEIRDVASGESRVYVLNAFMWPDTGATAMSGLRFWGAIVDPASNTLFGELAVVSWAFGP